MKQIPHQPDDIYSEIINMISVLDKCLYSDIEIPIVNVADNGIEDIVNSYLEPDPDDDYEYNGHSGESYIEEIDAIFDR